MVRLDAGVQRHGHCCHYCVQVERSRNRASAFVANRIAIQEDFCEYGIQFQRRRDRNGPDRTDVVVLQVQ